MAPGADEVDDAALVEHVIDGDGQDDPLRARRVALEEAAQHEAKIKAKMSEVKAELEKMKDSRKGKGSGNPGKEHSKKKRMLEGQLLELENGRLPAANAGRARRGAADYVGAAANAADEDSDDGAEDEDEEIVTENPTYYKIPLGQRLWIDKVKKDVKGATSGRRTCFAQRRAPRSSPGPRPRADVPGRDEDPHLRPHLTDGKPKPPCCYGCGWNSTIVSDGWNHDGRRVVGISKDDWVMGPTLKCKTCEGKCKARRSKAPEEKKEDAEFMKVFMKGYRYKFESYSAESVRLYEEKYPGFMAKQDFVITTRRTAMTRTLADIVKPLVNSGMNPNNISNLLAETKDLALTRSLLNATGAISDATAPGQRLFHHATALNRATLPNFVDADAGVLRRFDSLKDTSAPEKFSWSGPVVCIDDAAGDARALAALRDVRRVAVDMEWRAQPLSNVSVVQIGVKDAVYLWRVKDSVPAGLAAILRNEGIEKIGVNFQGDITRLTPARGRGGQGEIIELSDLANDTLKIQKRRWSLADLLDGGDDGAADDGADDGAADDGADGGADDAGDLPNDDVDAEQEAPPDSVLAAASKMVVEYEGSNVAGSLELPTFLDKSVRRAIRQLAHDLDLISESVGVEGVDRHLVISRRERSSATPAATLEPADGAAAEERLRQRLRRLRARINQEDPAAYVRRMVRRFIPEPDVLERDLTKVYDFFKGLKDAETGQAFFRGPRGSTTDARVRKGYLSDHPDVELYVPKKKLATGFVVYRCLRTSSPLEATTST
ncbi:hypothetical protein JL720_15642 [Aureococcus anophagefferens]|nr:hypothetical protein JL720_15642 [Aureococcus anophagefferens]